MLVDVHTHIFSSAMQENRGDLVSRDPGFRCIYQDEKAKMVNAQTVVAMLEREHVDKAVVFGFPWQEIELCKRGNDYVLESMARFPDRLIGFITLPWGNGDAVLEECERGLTAGAHGVGELACYHEPLTKDTIRRLDPLANMLAEKKVPLLLHINEPVGHEYPGKTMTDLSALQHFIASHPDLLIILAHWGGGFFFFELMPEIHTIAGNVFYDTAASPFLYHPNIYEVALKVIGEDRLLFGSDYPLLSPKRYFSEMETSIPSERVRKKIKGGNAKSLFGL